MTTELLSFEEAAALAIAETSEATGVEDEASLPEAESEAVVEEGQADSEPDEQADSQSVEGAPTEEGESEGEEESLFAEVEVEVEDSVPEVNDETLIPDVPGFDKPVSLRELKEAAMRHADYTQKTQLVAEQRKSNEKAIAFVEALQGNSEAVIRQLAEQVGLIEPGAQPFKVVEFSPIKTLEETEAEIEARVQAALEEHPVVVEAKVEQAKRLIGEEFDRIGKANGLVISEADRQVVLKEAQRRGVADLELVFTSLMSQRQKQAAEKQSLKDAAPSRPTGNTSTEANTSEADSFEEAAAMAASKLGITLNMK